MLVKLKRVILSWRGGNTEVVEGPVAEIRTDGVIVVRAGDKTVLAHTCNCTVYCVLYEQPPVESVGAEQ